MQINLEGASTIQHRYLKNGDTASNGHPLLTSIKTGLSYHIELKVSIFTNDYSNNYIL